MVSSKLAIPFDKFVGMFLLVTAPRSDRSRRCVLVFCLGRHFSGGGGEMRETIGGGYPTSDNIASLTTLYTLRHQSSFTKQVKESHRPGKGQQISFAPLCLGTNTQWCFVGISMHWLEQLVRKHCLRAVCKDRSQATWESMLAVQKNAGNEFSMICPHATFPGSSMAIRCMSRVTFFCNVGVSSLRASVHGL